MSDHGEVELDHDSDLDMDLDSTPTTATDDSSDSSADDAEAAAEKAEKTKFLDGAAASVAEISKVHSTLVASSDRLNRAIGANSESGVRSVRPTLVAQDSRIAAIQGRVPEDTTGGYTTIEDDLNKLCGYALTRKESQLAIADAYIAGKRGDALTATGQPWGHRARLDFDRTLAKVKKDIAVQRAKL